MWDNLFAILYVYTHIELIVEALSPLVSLDPTFAQIIVMPWVLFTSTAGVLLLCYFYLAYK